jgi:hypothetical protein
VIVAPAHQLEPRCRRRGSFFDTGPFCSIPRIRRHRRQQGKRCRMTELLIGAVSWFATFGFIAAAIVEAFR